ncbi:neutral zinc metallopeptidase [Nocardioides sp. cx-173]|uniref:KPN_02809 family neutral zinc metallopeptidase n=1 Tax=Nocardioides sp. cx-173 TaxID=2898796 RepID=UPI001E4C432C|nr:neutral zinc metallopeptidase [Nocardioides sp. cx-173]MCD4525844.1 neutral zinc metallopeptidase [Nocardioides sp. cx-173]UGB39997.1 neutral zinc metallopeptidase [Nocardioides sp. cx-173]
MRFNPKARLDTSRMRDAGRGTRGGGRGGGRGLPIPGGIGGGGIGGVVLLVVLFVVAQCSGVDILGGGGGGGTGGSGSAFDTSRMADTGRYAKCEDGNDANEDKDCQRVAVENSLYQFWSEELGEEFQPQQGLVTFSGSVETGCGGATSDVGPFYCPPDQTIYLDSTFFDQVLEDQLGGPDGGFVEAYVLAHEYGHHIQNLLGAMGKVRTQQGPQSDAVKLELQADCYAGMWTRAATQTEDRDGNVLFSSLTDEDIRLALEAAAAVGDDRIQSKTQGQVTEESWTHGSAEQRQRWFEVGLSEGSLQACDTFDGRRV